MKGVKMLVPWALRIIGGVHVSCLPESLDPVFDAAVLGDGEETLREIVRLGNKDNLSEISGTCTFKKGQVVINPRSPVNLNTLPIPKLHLYAPLSYQNGNVGFITSKGCPFQCVFCYSKVMRSRVDYYPVEWVADQFEYAIKGLKANFLVLWDDTIGLDLNRLSAIADELECRGLTGFRLSVNLRSSLISEELCQVLKRLKVESWFTGFESGSQNILKKIKGSDSSVDKHKQLIQLSHKYNVSVIGSFMIAMPDEQISDMQETIEFMNYIYSEKHAGRFNGRLCLTLATPMPGTCWWKIAEKRGLVNNHMDWDKLRVQDPKQPFLLDSNVPRDLWESTYAKAANKLMGEGDIVVWK